MQNSIFIRAALLCLFVVVHQQSSVSAFTVPSRSCCSFAILQRPQGASSLESESGDNNESEKKETTSDPEEMQRELNAMMAGSGSGSDSGGSLFEDDNDEGLAPYNAAPLFSGVIVTILSFALTGYGIYAGLTGDDPMSGHPSIPIQ
jgi:hypothetical protein